ncbi:(2Fe-2S)-binding protein [Paenibacillus alkalitolerans]|uniref:(2Fe-2S)-binding protein n=1 Tax=Paenibacillus alkalitolerans TaxID=2799335 RepID=UPI0018F3203B|nr:(2Fe-2S)-binding protein [Paenibacillus alkalitolerans]
MNETETIICRCEEVTLRQLMETAERYRCSPRELKLRTRAGMGYCGGRTCREFIETIARHVNGISQRDDVPLVYQPPVRPVSFHTLGGDGK